MPINFRNRIILPAFLLCWFILRTLPAHAQLLRLNSLGSPRQPAVTAEIYLDHSALPPNGHATLAVVMKVAPGFHAQSAQPFEGFIATTVTPKPAEGITFDPVKYPQHKEIDAPGLLPGGGKLPVYEGSVTFLIPLKVAPDAQPGDRSLEITLHYQACDDKACQLPADIKLTTPLTISAAGTSPPPEEHTEIFTAARPQQFLTMDAPPTPIATSAPAGSADDLKAIQQLAYSPAEGSESSSTIPLWQLILFALAGGAILNIMPCVLPVIPLKVLTLVQQSHGNRKIAITHALIFSLGIVTLFIALAAVFGALRLAGGGGGQVVYGQQFSSPLFLISMGYIVLALALSMLSVWTINPPQAVYAADTQHTGYLGSFTMGLLATLLATPCSAPLLGPVLAWALVQPVLIMILMFALVGVGMAIPYVLLAAFPAGLDKLPRAGRWSELLKQFLGLVMVGVALYLLLQLPAAIWPWALTGGLLLSMVLWGWGQIPLATMDRGKIWGIRAAVVAIGALLGLGLWHWADQPANESWKPFSIAELDNALAAQRPVVIDFTASWCINCKVVEARVLESASVKEAFTNSHAVLLKADLSGENPPVKELLAKLDSRSIPVLAIFSPKEPLRPVVLRDIYTRERVLGVLNAAK